MLFLEVRPKFSWFQDCKSGARGQKYEKQQPLAPAKYFRFSSFWSLTERAQFPILRIHYSDKTVHTAIHTSLLHTCKIYSQVSLLNSAIIVSWNFSLSSGAPLASNLQLLSNYKTMNSANFTMYYILAEKQRWAFLVYSN